MTPPRVPRRRLTKDEWEAELARAKGVQAADVETFVGPWGRLEIPKELRASDDPEADRRFMAELESHLTKPLVSRSSRHPAVIQYGSNACVCGEPASAGCHYSDALIVDDPSPHQLRTRTGRRRLWWQRGWKR
jgi:hypothetical protein